VIIRNYKQLATTQARRDALKIAEAGYKAIQIDRIVEGSLNMHYQTLIIDGHQFVLNNYENVYVVGVGKGSAMAAEAIEKLIGPKRISDGCVIDIASRPMKKIRSMIGTHPLPSEQNITATTEVVKILERAGKKDLVIAIICGGGSALFCKPGNLTCLELQFISTMLLRAGAGIEEINTVRKHASQIHGGYMAKYAFPATVLSLIISDVPGNDIQMVASGPTVYDTTTKAQATSIAKRYGLPPLGLVETPKDRRFFKKVHNVVIACGDVAVDGMEAEAKKLGYKPRVLSRKLDGYASERGPELAAKVKPGEALLACGETGVIVTKVGKGGRNQDLALSAVSLLAPDSAIVAAASDGKDNVAVAGAVTDGMQTRKRLRLKGINPANAVVNNNSYAALKATGDHLQIRKVTANVSDFTVAVRLPR
jgi:glycerate 2-kinase